MPKHYPLEYATFLDSTYHLCNLFLLKNTDKPLTLAFVQCFLTAECSVSPLSQQLKHTDNLGGGIRK